MVKVRKHFYFSGTVQGVGFRYRAKHAAHIYGLTGWVSNLWDGRVEMEIQGDERSIYEMISHIRTSSYIEIEDIEANDLPLIENEYRFKVR